MPDINFHNSFTAQCSNVRVGRMTGRHERKREKAHHAAEPHANQKPDDKIRHAVPLVWLAMNTARNPASHTRREMAALPLRGRPHYSDLEM